MLILRALVRIKGRPIYLYTFKPLTGFACRYSTILYCLLKLKYAYVFNLWASTHSLFNNDFMIYRCISMHTTTYTVRCARNRIYYANTFSDVSLGQSVTAAKHA